MKRSSLVSALLVGLSVTASASVAFAAPPVALGKPTTRTLQPSDPPPPEGGTTPAPATPAAAEPTTPTGEAVPAPATEPAATPAITIGTGNATPGSDTPGASATDPSKKPKPRPFAGTQVYMTTSTTTATIFKGQQQDYNPTVDSSIWLLPRYALSEAFQLRGRLIFNYEWTNSDDTQTRNEPRFSDTTLSLFYRKIPEIPGIGVKPAVALNVGLPTSPESRARTLIFSPGASLQLSKSIEHVLGGELSFLASTVYSHPVYRSTTPEIRNQAPYAFQCVGGTTCQDQLSGTFNPSDNISYTFLVAGEWGKWSPALYYLGASQFAYTGQTVEYNGKPVESAPGFRPTNIRQTSYFSAWLDYNANAWFTAEVGYWLSRSALSGDGQRGNIFVDRYQDMRVYIGANFNIDNIMKQLEGGPTDAGIVRAHNEKKPMWNY
jgi:hypothetical protein